MLEVRLGEERATWQKTKSKIRVVRGASFVMLFLLIVGAVAAFYFIFERAREQRLNKTQPATQSDR